MINQPSGGQGPSAFEFTARWLLALAGCLFLAGASGAAEPGWRQLSGHVPAVVGQLTPLSRLPAETNLSLAIGLPLRNPAELAALVEQIYDPGSTNYHHYRTTRELTERFGPSPADYQAVIDFAEARGLQVTGRSGNRLVLDVRGSVTHLEAAFKTRLHTYRHPTEARQFFAPEVEPAVPTNVPVADMWGLSDYGRPRPMIHFARPIQGFPLGASGSGVNGSFQGKDFRTAYVPGSKLTGSGQTAAVAEFDGYYASDITTYESQIQYTNVPLENVLVDGVSGIPGFSGVAGADGEVSLDIELIIALAPGLAKLQVYEGNSPYDVFNQIVTDNTAKQISCSWAFSTSPNNSFWPGGTGIGTLDSQLLLMAAQGQSFYVASGDADAYTGSHALSTRTGPVPVDSAYLTSVGGTMLTMNGTAAAWASEVVWNSGGNVGTGGGISPNYSIPAWQKSVSMASNGGSTTRRNIPDVAMTASNVYLYYNSNQVGIAYGTSCAAPLWAAFTALINQQALAQGGTTVGLLNSALYALGTNVLYPVCFHDVKTGNNIGTGTAGLFYATNGYDLCTGLGTPNGTNLINALAPPLLPFLYTQPMGVSFTNGGNLTLTALAGGVAPLTYQWQLNGTNLAAGGGITGVASNVLAIVAATTNNSGAYRLVVTNPNGAVTSLVAAVNIGWAPVFTSQPAGLTVLVGSNAVFSVTNSGSTPLAFQWRRGGTNLVNGAGVAGANTSQLTFTGVTTNSAGSLTVVVTNVYGAVTSSPASLMVVQPPIITVPLAGQTVECSSNAMLGITLLGTPPPVCHWWLDGAALAGVTNSSLTLTNVHWPNHLVRVVATNLYGSTTNTVTLTVQDSQAPRVVLQGANPLTLELGASFADPGATATDACAGAEGVTVLGTVQTHAVGTNVLVYQATDGNGNTGSVSRIVVVRDSTPPTIQWSFTNLVLSAGADCVAVMPEVTGTNFILATDVDDTVVVTQNPAANTLLNLGTNQVLLSVTDLAGNQAFSTNTVIVLDETPPQIISQPQSVTNTVGTTATFSVSATACTPLSYQWLFNDGVMAGQTNATLILASLDASAMGNYQVVVTAAGGATTSEVVRLTVAAQPFIQWSFTNLVLAAGTNCTASMPDITSTNFIQATVWSGPPVITQTPDTNAILALGTNMVVQTVLDSLGNVVYATNRLVVQDETPPLLTLQPQSTTNLAGTTASFSAAATACTPVTYQWLFNGDRLAGETNATLTLNNVDTTATGNYAMVATADGGATTSAVVVLTVVVPPVIHWSFTNLVLSAQKDCLAEMPDITGTNAIQATVSAGGMMITQIPDTNADLPIGTNLVWQVVQDDYGNTVYATNAIVVQDGTPPVLTSQPQSGTNLAGTTVSLAVAATACTPLSYQWLFNNAVMAEQTNATLTVSNVDGSVAGDYVAVVTAAGGATTSAVATLTVAALPAIQWSFTNLVLAAGDNCQATMPDVTDTNFILATIWSGPPIITQSPDTNALLNVGTNLVVLTVSDLLGSAVSVTNILVVLDETPPVLTSQPQSGTNVVGATVSLAVAATACTDLSYQWSFNSGSLIGQTNATLTLVGVDFSAAGNYTVTVTSAGGSVTSDVATLTVIPRPEILASFTNLVLAAGADCLAEMPEVTGTNYILATVGVGEPVITQSPDTNADLPIGTNLVIQAVSDSLGNTVYVTNTILVVDVNAPVLTSQPVSVTNLAGTTASFAVMATACTPLSYQWWFNSVAMNGQTNAALTLGNVDPSLAGNYQVVVTSAGGGDQQRGGHFDRDSGADADGDE